MDKSFLSVPTDPMTQSRQSTPQRGAGQAASEQVERGLALHQSGRPAEAAKLYEAALAQEPAHPGANHLLGLVHLQQGRPADAAEHIARAVGAQPENPQYQANLGVALNAAGRNAEAVEALKRALAIDPDFAEAYSNLGMALRGLGLLEEAIAAYRDAVRLRPKEAGFYFNMATTLKDAGYLFEAESAYRRAILHRPRYPAALNGLALALDQQGRTDEALAVVDAALRDSPRSAELTMRRARFLYRQGRVGEAVAGFDHSIELNPRSSEARVHRAYALRHAVRGADVEAMAELFRSDAAPINERVFAGFGLGKALTDLGEHEEAIETFVGANFMHRQRTPFSLDRTIADLQSDIDRFADEPQATGGLHDASPIFVVGLPRAGKTTIEKILAGHPEAEGVGELPTLGRLVRQLVQEQPDAKSGDIAPDRYTELGRAYMREAQSLVSRGKLLIDTMPSNYRHIGFIRRALPNARIIRCTRDQADHCVAMFEKHLSSRGYEYTSNLDELQAYHAAYSRMMSNWHAQFPGDIHDMDVGRLASDRHATIRKLLEFCGLEWSDACLDDVRSEPEQNDWPPERIAANRKEHLAAWHRVRPQLWG